MMFLELNQFAPAEVDAMRARGKSRRTTVLADLPVAGNPGSSRQPRANTITVLFIALQMDSEEFSLKSKGPSRDAGIHYL